MINTKYIAIFIVILISYSCDKKCYRELSVEEKSRLAYKGGEKIIFQSNILLMDTLYINLKIEETIFEKESKCKNEQHLYYISGVLKKKII